MTFINVNRPLNLLRFNISKPNNLFKSDSQRLAFCYALRFVF